MRFTIMYLVPYFLAVLAMSRDPSYTKSVVSRRSASSATSKPSKSGILLSRPPPKWANSYHAGGIISIPMGEINETFEAWYDKNDNLSRIDYQNGKTQIYQFSINGTWNTIKVLHRDSSEKNLTKKYFGVNGINKYSNGPQIILPDMRNFTILAEQKWRDQKIELWLYETTIGDTFTRRSIWLVKNLDNNLHYPVRYEVTVINVKFRLNLDSFEILYKYFDDIKIPQGIFDRVDTVGCHYFNAPHLDHIYSYNPMQELVNSYLNHYYYLDPIFEDFNRLHHHHYTNDDSLEYVERKKIFHHNLRYVHWENRGNPSYTLAVNQFTDRYPKELMAMFSNDILHVEPQDHSIFRYNDQDIKHTPSEFNWVDKGAVTSVKNQSVCGSGWSFAISGVVEGVYFLNYKYLQRFSAQALIECIWRRIKNDCDDGGRQQALDLIESDGIPTEEQYDSYTFKGGNCRMSYARNYTYTKAAGYRYVNSTNEDVLKYVLVHYGPISVTIHASSKSFMFYSGGIYYSTYCLSSLTDVNHSALLVGYGTMNDTPYWIVKNSWTTEYGRSGYIYISRKNNNCGVLTSPVSVILSLK